MGTHNKTKRPTTECNMIPLRVSCYVCTVCVHVYWTSSDWVMYYVVSGHDLIRCYTISQCTYLVHWVSPCRAIFLRANRPFNFLKTAVRASVYWILPSSVLWEYENLTMLSSSHNFYRNNSIRATLLSKIRSTYVYFIGRARAGMEEDRMKYLNIITKEAEILATWVKRNDIYLLLKVTWEIERNMGMETMKRPIRQHACECRIRILERLNLNWFRVNFDQLFDTISGVIVTWSYFVPSSCKMENHAASSSRDSKFNLSILTISQNCLKMNPGRSAANSLL
jgi:hypothetical protein